MSGIFRLPISGTEWLMQWLKSCRGIFARKPLLLIALKTYGFMGAAFLAISILYSVSQPKSTVSDVAANIFCSIGLMTGSDPYGLRDLAFRGVTTNTLDEVMLWIFAWIIHVISWLIVPLVVGVMLADVLEQQKENHKRDGLSRLADLVEEASKSPFGRSLAPDDVEELAKKVMENLKAHPPS